jgi:hypothetical protein
MAPFDHCLSHSVIPLKVVVVALCRASLEKTRSLPSVRREGDGPWGIAFNVRAASRSFPGSKQSDLVDLAGAPDGEGQKKINEKGHEPGRTIHVRSRIRWVIPAGRF